MCDSNKYHKLHPPPETPPEEICTCAGMKPIKLMDALSYNPLHCIDCNLERTPESLDLSESLAQSIAFWRDVHSGIL